MPERRRQDVPFWLVKKVIRELKLVRVRRGHMT